MTIPVNMEPSRGFNKAGAFEFGLGEGNRYGYISVCLWPSNAGHDRHGPAYAEHAKRRRALTERIAALVETDETCQQILDAEARAAAVHKR